MKKIFYDPIKIIVWCSCIVSLIMTPFWNVDSLIVPKLIILFSFSLFLLPTLSIFTWKSKTGHLVTIYFILSISIIIYQVFVLINSTAPLEQQFFGRGGRGLGFATQVALVIFGLSICLFFKYEKIKVVLNVFLITVSISSFYSLSQWFGFDFFDWETRTNGVIGTLGNPNFQSSFAAAALIPATIVFTGRRYNFFYRFLLVIFLFGIIYATQSTQGYLIALSAALFYSLIYFWYKSKLFFSMIFIFTSGIGIITTMGMLNNGPLAPLLYKLSVRSRGEFLQGGFSMARDNPLFGVGLDSFGDYYLQYRSRAAATGMNGGAREFTDHAHNLIIQNAATGGLILAMLNVVVLLLVLISFGLIQKKMGKFDKNISALFVAWLCFQLQSMINPANISMLLWSSILSGCLVGMAKTKGVDYQIDTQKINNKKFNLLGPVLFFVGLFVMQPYFMSDKDLMTANKTGSAELAIESAMKYPESTVRYGRVAGELIRSNLPDYALNVSKSAVQFNENDIYSWGLIFVNPSATIQEKENARSQILRLDPFNEEVRSMPLSNDISNLQ